MRSLLRTVPLIGSLLISAAPVQAIETFEELMEACNASEEIDNICTKAGVFSGTVFTVSLLCELEEKGSLTREELVLNWDEFVEENGMTTPLSQEAVEFTLKNFPDCSLKPKL
ncbi:hypothetical protein [Synechococcus sp. KORDI-100]|uniref:hypothetical protein n=1 Tax=Synechococcus sp. KORDI-100 TaxID=1280380 RepID=UPI0012E02630|nr:hypothetical protein [Synechococcus sp. KORDI-100]